MELDHIFHPAHKLTYHETVVVKRDVKGPICAACVDEITSEYYGCAECNFFLHALCAHRPSELTHSLHPLHPLQLLHKTPYDGITECDVCQNIAEGFTYHCRICEFDLDFICAFSDGSKLNHIFHKSHVLTYDDVGKNGGRGDECRACLEEISSECYTCRSCNFYLHKACAQFPVKLTHSLHPLHSLRLLRESPYHSPSDVVLLNPTCNECRQQVKGYFYHCDVCDFDLHLRCAFPNNFPGSSKMNHSCHSHILTCEKVVKRADRGLVCAACLAEISGPLADYYSCRKCSFFLHKLCSERPQKLTIPSHPQHPLYLLPRDPNTGGTAFRFICQKVMKAFVYGCLDCKSFCVDFICAFIKPEKRIRNFGQLHEHPLIFQPRPAKFSCDLCSSAGGEEDDEDQSYSCLKCDFYIHKSCAFTELTQTYKDHQHPLSLVQGVPEDLEIYGALYCDVCRKIVSSEDLVSHCARCRYFVHVTCMITDDADPNSNINPVDYLNDSLIKLQLNGDEFVNWPPRDISSELIGPFLVGKNSIMMDVQEKITHSSHEQHEMILFQELCVNTDDFFKEEDEEILCDGCIHPITSPYYCCEECSYYLHLSCANLKSAIKHFSHPHELRLTYQSRFYSAFVCDRCDWACNGFEYRCTACCYSLDLACAALPAIIMHQTHEHVLFEMQAKDEALCYACDETVRTFEYIFKCRLCDVYLHYKCVMYPRSIRHRWDRQHPILLRSPPHADHPDHFMCDMCEELIHPMHWLYSCFKCDVSFHTGCAPGYQKHQNIKYGEVQVSFHQHMLKFLRKATLKSRCNRCKRRLFDRDAFECETCYACFCYDCVNDNNV